MFEEMNQIVENFFNAIDGLLPESSNEEPEKSENADAPNWYPCDPSGECPYAVMHCGTCKPLFSGHWEEFNENFL